MNIIMKPETCTMLGTQLLQQRKGLKSIAKKKKNQIPITMTAISESYNSIICLLVLNMVETTSDSVVND